LDVIDHRAWSPRGINTTLVNEVYARCPVDVSAYDTPEEALDALIEQITNSIKAQIDQPDSKVKVQRWFPGEYIHCRFRSSEKLYSSNPISIPSSIYFTFAFFSVSTCT
jgi:hypothetical protein